MKGKLTPDSNCKAHVYILHQAPIQLLRVMSNIFPHGLYSSTHLSSSYASVESFTPPSSSCILHLYFSYESTLTICSVIAICCSHVLHYSESILNTHPACCSSFTSIKISINTHYMKLDHIFILSYRISLETTQPDFTTALQGSQ